MNDIKKEINEIKEKLDKSRVESEKAVLLDQLDKLNKQLEDMKHNKEKVSTEVDPKEAVSTAESVELGRGTIKESSNGIGGLALI